MDTKVILPVEYLQITTVSKGERTQHMIEGFEITSDIEHDIADATLTVTFCNVESVKVAYKHNREKQT